jgi:hypothetical protein
VVQLGLRKGRIGASLSPKWVPAKVWNPPTAADLFTIQDGPQSDPKRPFARVGDRRYNNNDQHP